MANTRYTISELATTQAAGIFETGKTVTIQVYNADTGASETLLTSTCDEIGSTGVFRWEFSNLQTMPAGFTQYLYIMTDNSTPAISRREMVDVAGWVQNLGEGLIPANTCKITFNIYNADGLCAIEPNDLFDPSLSNYIELKGSFFGNSRYFKLGQYRPNYDQSSAQAFFIMPQGATIDIVLNTIGINATNITVPSQDTIDLNALLTA